MTQTRDSIPVGAGNLALERRDLEDLALPRRRREPTPHGRGRAHLEKERRVGRKGPAVDRLDPGRITASQRLVGERGQREAVGYDVHSRCEARRDLHRHVVEPVGRKEERQRRSVEPGGAGNGLLGRTRLSVLPLPSC